MCRWLAYSGLPIPLEELLFKPENSLIRQSLSASRSIVPTNGDGFGLGWYGDRGYPGLFRDTLPAWNDANLLNLSQQISSKLFFAHVRASTGTSTSRENCHPFRQGEFLFMHNGAIGGFDQIRRDIEQLIAPAIYLNLLGTTDSEAFFLLALSNGLAEDVPGALATTIRQSLDIMTQSKVDRPFRMTAAISDGECIYAVRYSSDGNAPTLYYAVGGEITVEDHRVKFTNGAESVIVLSEPLDEQGDEWAEIPECHLLCAAQGKSTVEPFAV
jgi:glutamine amidotransferase